MKYTVYVYPSDYATFDVEAKSKDDAWAKAEAMINNGTARPTFCGERHFQLSASGITEVEPAYSDDV